MSEKQYALDYKEVVTLGGTRQHIRVRGTDASKPVLLFLHGGPGVSDRHWVLKNQSGLAEVCTMVCWDQLGSGKSWSKEQSQRSMKMDDMVGYAQELTEYLCKKFSKDKIYIVGHSWGSVLGVLLAQKRPERIAAYIGMGQVVDLDENEQLSYAFVMDEAKKRGDKKALSELAAIEPINGNYGSLDNLLLQRDYMTKYGGEDYKKQQSILTAVAIPVLTSPEYSLMDLYRYAKGSYYSLRQLWDEVAEKTRFFESAKELAVPVYITQGRHDQNTPSVIAERWFDALEAPHKEWIWFEESGHSPIKEEPELWGKTARNIILSTESKAQPAP